MELIEAYKILEGKVIAKSDDDSPPYPEELYLISLLTSYRSYILSSEKPTIEKLSTINKKQSEYLLSLLKNIVLLSNHFRIPVNLVVENIGIEKLIDPYDILQYITTNMQHDNYPFVYDENKILRVIKTIFRVIAKDKRILKDVFLKYAYTKHK